MIKSAGSRQVLIALVLSCLGVLFAGTAQAQDPTPTPTESPAADPSPSPTPVPEGNGACLDFESQAEAQAFYEAAGGPDQDPHGLDDDGDGTACEHLDYVEVAALAQGEEVGVPDKDCAEFNTQAEAQAYFVANGGPANDEFELDVESPGDADDGVACKEFFGTAGSASPSPSPSSSAGASPTASALFGLGGTPTPSALPKSGAAVQTIALIGALLGLLGAALIVYAHRKRGGVTRWDDYSLIRW